jgi:glutamate synthase domain-containing protein 2
MQAIQQSHQALVSAGLREQITLIGSGGIAAAEHTPKAIISGLDAVAIETAPLLAVQASFQGEVRRPEQASLVLPALQANWARQRLVNLIASWRDQMLEILGAMGLREVRRLRGEMGRAMSQDVLEQEAFAGIEGFGDD